MPLDNDLRQCLALLPPQMGTRPVCIFDGSNSKIRIEQATTLGTTSSAYWDGIVVGAKSAAINALGGEVAATKA